MTTFTQRERQKDNIHTEGQTEGQHSQRDRGGQREKDNMSTVVLGHIWTYSWVWTGRQPNPLGTGVWTCCIGCLSMQIYICVYYQHLRPWLVHTLCYIQSTEQHRVAPLCLTAEIYHHDSEAVFRLSEASLLDAAAGTLTPNQQVSICFRMCCLKWRLN